MKLTKRQTLRLIVLGGILLAALSIAAAQPWQYLDNQGLQEHIASYGPLAPVIFFAIFIVGVFIFIPISPLSSIGGALFGPWVGFILSWLAAFLGASIAFMVARKLGNTYFQKILASRHMRHIRAYEHRLEYHGIMTTFVLRAVGIVPYSLANYGLGITNVSLRYYCIGTALGITPGLLAFSFFGNALASLRPHEIMISSAILLALALVSHIAYHYVTRHIHIMRCKNDKELYGRAAEIIAQQIRAIYRRKEPVVIALPGGRSVAGLCAALKEKKIPWHAVHVFIADERMVAIDSPESNGGLVQQCLTAIPGVQASQIHLFNGADDMKTEIAAYTAELEGVGGFYDILVVSAGEDGHIAGLFPNHRSISDPEPFFIALQDAPKPPSHRVSSSRALVEQTETIVALFNGKAKEQAFTSYRDPHTSPEQCPAKIINQAQKVFILTNLTT